MDHPTDFFTIVPADVALMTPSSSELEFPIWISGGRIIRFSCPGHNELEPLAHTETLRHLGAPASAPYNGPYADDILRPHLMSERTLQYILCATRPGWHHAHEQTEILYEANRNLHHGNTFPGGYAAVHGDVHYHRPVFYYFTPAILQGDAHEADYC